MPVMQGNKPLSARANGVMKARSNTLENRGLRAARAMRAARLFLTTTGAMSFNIR